MDGGAHATQLPVSSALSPKFSSSDNPPQLDHPFAARAIHTDCVWATICTLSRSRYRHGASMQGPLT
jgi:hypothetical protein